LFYKKKIIGISGKGVGTSYKLSVGYLVRNVTRNKGNLLRGKLFLLKTFERDRITLLMSKHAGFRRVTTAAEQEIE